jgi:hypothetical protein
VGKFAIKHIRPLALELSHYEPAPTQMQQKLVAAHRTLPEE